ncbi:hypothetical protein CCP3SC15_1380003 [Gammaproteobacteria bacterium]
MAKIRPLLDRLATQLAKIDSEAADTVDELLTLTQGTPLANEFQKIAGAVTEYEFEEAEAALRALTDDWYSSELSASSFEEQPLVLDISTGLAYWHNPELLRKYLAKFVQDHADYIDDLAAHLAAGERLDAARKIHRLKGTAVTLGLMELAPAVVEMDRALTVQDTLPSALLEGLLAKLRQTMTKSLVAIRDHLAVVPSVESSADGETSHI